VERTRAREILTIDYYLSRWPSVDEATDNR